MTVRVKLFAVLREKAKCGEVTLELPAGARVGDAAEMISRQFPEISTLVSRVALAVNREYADSDKVLCDGDELALLPAVSGGVDTNTLSPSPCLRRATSSRTQGEGWGEGSSIASTGDRKPNGSPHATKCSPHPSPPPDTGGGEKRRGGRR